MNRAEILDLAKQYITQDRNSQYGEPEDAFDLIAQYWTVYFNHRVTAVDVAILMTLLKIARMRASPEKADHYADAAGYLACGGEVATRCS